MSEPLIDIRPDHWAIVADILRRHVPDREVWAFGSRATWNAKEYSDLDLAVIGEAPLSLSVSAALADHFAESDLPFKVDVVDWATTSESFREVIRRDKVVVKGGSRNSGMASEWREMTLGQVTDFLSGGTPSKDQPSYWGGSTPWVSAKDMKRFRLDDTEDHVTAKGVANGTKLIPSGTVLLLARGMTLLNDVPICTANRPMTFNQDVKALRPKADVRDDFLPYLLLGNKDRLLSLVDLAGHGTGRLNSDELKALDVLLPPLPEQRAIAHVLGTLDNKIELNRRMNETLEAMARALFKSWFVDFDSVRAKMNLPSPSGRGAGGEGAQPSLRTSSPIPTELLDFARQLRRQATDAETLLWRLLRGRQLANAKFRRQYAFPPYILDFYCHELKLAVELDGGQHNEDAERRRDARRDEYLAEQGIRVLRFWNNDVLRETEAVLEAIYAAVVEHSNGVPSPPPPLPGGEGSSGIPKPLADLFPARLVASELGEIPEGWEVRTLGDFSSLNPETWTTGTRPAVINYVDLSNTKWGRIEAVMAYAQQDAPSRAQRVLRLQDTIVGTVRPGNGSYAFISEDGLTGSTGFAVLRPLKVEYAEFVYFAATAPENIAALSHLADGGAYPAVRPEVVAAMQVIRSGDDVMERFSRVAWPLLTKMAENERESRTLATLRDTLLPKLIFGELRVKDAERVAVGET